MLHLPVFIILGTALRLFFYPVQTLDLLLEHADLVVLDPDCGGLLGEAEKQLMALSFSFGQISSSVLLLWSLGTFGRR